MLPTNFYGSNANSHTPLRQNCVEYLASSLLPEKIYQGGSKRPQPGFTFKPGPTILSIYNIFLVKTKVSTNTKADQRTQIKMLQKSKDPRILNSTLDTSLLTIATRPKRINGLTKPQIYPGKGYHIYKHNKLPIGKQVQSAQVKNQMKFEHSPRIQSI